MSKRNEVAKVRWWRCREEWVLPDLASGEDVALQDINRQ
jgi:hypothetical protein